jgi:hypothetical protein
MREISTAAWERYLSDGNGEALLASVDGDAPVLRPKQEEYPELHRLRDVEIGGRAYRVLRLAKLNRTEDRLFIEVTDFHNFDAEGVPYGLQGEALRRWIRDEIASPTKAEKDWSRYLSA